MTDVEKLKESMKFLLNYAKQENIVLFNPKGVKSIEAVLIKYKREHATEVKVKEMLKQEMAPLRQDIDRILEALNVKKDIDIPIRQDVKEEKKPKRIKWTTLESTDELEIHECVNGHKITVFKAPGGSKHATIDNGVNREIKSKEDLEALKKEAENMK